MVNLDREPTADELAEIEWWTSISESRRADWLQMAESAKPDRGRLAPFRLGLERLWGPEVPLAQLGHEAFPGLGPSLNQSLSLGIHLTVGKVIIASQADLGDNGKQRDAFFRQIMDGFLLVTGVIVSSDQTFRNKHLDSVGENIRGDELLRDHELSEVAPVLEDHVLQDEQRPSISNDVERQAYGTVRDGHFVVVLKTSVPQNRS